MGSEIERGAETYCSSALIIRKTKKESGGGKNKKRTHRMVQKGRKNERNTQEKGKTGECSKKN